MKDIAECIHILNVYSFAFKIRLSITMHFLFKKKQTTTKKGWSLIEPVRLSELRIKKN